MNNRYISPRLNECINIALLVVFFCIIKMRVKVQEVTTGHRMCESGLREYTKLQINLPSIYRKLLGVKKGDELDLDLKIFDKNEGWIVEMKEAI